MLIQSETGAKGRLQAPSGVSSMEARLSLFLYYCRAYAAVNPQWCGVDRNGQYRKGLFMVVEFKWDQRRRRHDRQFTSLEAVPEVLDLKGVADLVDRSTRTVQRWVKSGKLPAGGNGYFDPKTGGTWFTGGPCWLKCELIQTRLVRYPE